MRWVTRLVARVVLFWFVVWCSWSRCKFLRAEKTEFDHLQEVIKCLVLVRFDVGFHLRYNGKMVLSLHEVGDEISRACCVVLVCGLVFLE